MTATEWLMLIALSALWGGSFFFNELAVRELPVLTVVAIRVALAGAILTLVLRATGQALPRGGQIWAALFGMGLLNNVIPFSLIVWGQQHIASGVAAILNAATPLFTVLLAHWLTQDERMSRAKLLGVLTGFAGGAVMIGPAALRDLGTQVAAQLMCLGAALSYAFAGIYGRRFRATGVAPVGAATGQVIAASVILVPLSLMLDRPWLLPVPSVGAIAALIGVAALSTALAYVLYFRLLHSAGVTNLLLVTFLIPVSAILLGVLFLDERLLPQQMAGMMLIGLGLLLIDGRVLRRKKRAPVS
ncbi:MAG: DMT family transporter [Paracoccus sp. (in: a-proteobacteria)]|uniref:DMT family transporter n=1 Tax=Paracoccus sp. TaxID=267 RepID=UPI0026DEF866|nr:DMT family transporter [Paracoccus sp. (in: a-proteobacteria)]MDO5632786.1 DMT family transporter [Paracoccus sp. (in: a-proteobacteria)]